MDTFLSLFVAFSGALAFLALLSIGYASVQRKHAGRVSTAIILGGLFGGVAALEMFHPIILTEGVILDMRNVPIILAGAFLGWRGLLACIAVAALARVGIGGVGAPAGVVGMILAGGAGLLWAHLTRSVDQRGLIHWLALGAMGSCHLAAVLALPGHIQGWVLSMVAFPMIAMNLISVPAAAFLLDRERRSLDREKSLQAAVRDDPETGLMTREAWLREVKAAQTAGEVGSVAAILKVDLNRTDWLVAQHGTAETHALMRALRHRLKGALHHADIVGRTSQGHLVMPLTGGELRAADATVVDLRRRIGDAPFVLADGRMAKLRVSASVVPVASSEQITDVLDHRRKAGSIAQMRGAWARSADGEGSGGSFGNRRDVDQSRHAELFAKADGLLAGTMRRTA